MSHFELWRSRANSALPYIATIFYAEIILIFIFMNFLYGKPVAVSAGLLLSALLTAHVIQLFNGSEACRRIQLLMMDVHVAWSIVFVASRMIPGFPLSGFDIAVIIFRTMAVTLELPLILLVARRGTGRD